MTHIGGAAMVHGQSMALPLGRDIRDIYSFVIQAGNPRFSAFVPKEGDSLCDAIEGSFHSLTEKLIVEWNYISFPLDYKYDVSVLADDIVELVDVVTSQPEGSWCTAWPSSGFVSDWRVSWNEAELRIDADWRVVNGRALALLVNSPGLVMARREFLSEWKRPLEVVLAGLAHSGYTHRR